MTLLRLAIALSLALSPLAASAQGDADASLALGRQVATRYDSAFASLVAKARRDTTVFGWLLTLDSLKAARVGWAVEQKGYLRAITTSRRDAYLVVVPPDDPAYARMGSVMETDDGATLRATRVKADTIGAEWAAIFLAFELSHIRDDLLGLLSSTAKPAQFAASSRRAYGAEYLAARAFGGPPLEAHLDSVLAALAPQSPRELAEALLPVLQQSFDRFDTLISAQRALTTREEQRRAGVYAAALLLRYSDAKRVSDLDFAEALRCIGGCR